MLLQKIVLNNFRQFYGKQEIAFSTDLDKNVTLIHAENGVGKTTLLNALLWCFYKKTSEKFEDPDKIVCHQAIAEENFAASVEVYFEHEQKNYFVIRSVNEFTSDSVFEASRISKGNYHKILEPKVFVDNVIPQEMSKYFFFDGEYAETFASNNNKKAVQTAVENMLGCNIAIQTCDDLQYLIRSIDKKISGLTSSTAAETFQKQMDRLDEVETKDQEKLVRIDSNLVKSRDAKKAIEKTLRNTKGASDFQVDKAKYELQLKELYKKRVKIDARETEWINNESAGLLADKAIDDCFEIIEQAKSKGHIPSKIADTFVHDILKENICICGREFDDHSDEASSIKCLIKEAGTSTMNDRLLNVRGLIGKLQTLSPLKAFREINEARIKNDGQCATIERSIESCKIELRSSKVIDIAEKQTAIDKLEKEIEKNLTLKGGLSEASTRRLKEIENLRKKRDKHLVLNKKAAYWQKQVKLLEATKTKLETELKTYKSISRKSISGMVDQILIKTARKDYSAVIDENFNLNMYYAGTDTTVPKSSGENQLLSLAFISSLIKFSAERRNDVSNLLKPGTMAPLMLDSPFGQLDPSYRLGTSQFLPQLAGQVILLLSKTQGDSDVLKTLRPFIAQEYVLVSEVKSEKGEKPVDIITLGGKEIKASVYGSDKNCTRIKKIT